MKNKIKAIFNVLVKDILKPFIFYSLLFIIGYGIVYGIIKGTIWVFNCIFPNNGVTVIYWIIIGILLLFLIILAICWVIEYFKYTIIPNYKNKVEQLNNKDKK